jgi:hypothetical protein
MEGGKRIIIASTKSFWELDEDGNSKEYAIEMNNLTMAGLHHHKEKASFTKRNDVPTVMIHQGWQPTPDGLDVVIYLGVYRE